MSRSLRLQHIHVTAGDTEVVRDVSFAVPHGKIIALMGPNGSGKSSLVNAIMGHPRYVISQGNVVLDGEDITALPPHEKARKGLFLSFQYPPELAGVTVSSFLRSALNAKIGTNISVLDARKIIKEEMEKLGLDKEMIDRHVNTDFSGGEKKRLEILQLVILKPAYAMLDETDSGLDVDALRTIALGIRRFSKEMGILVITHHARILQYLVPDEVRIMREGSIVRSGGKELATEIEEKGYKD